MISCFANKRKKDQITRAKKLNPKRDKTQTVGKNGFEHKELAIFELKPKWVP